MRTFIAVLLLLLALATVPPLALAQGTYTQIDYPGASQTFCFGIDSAGDIVGMYLTSANGYSHGFLLRNGVYDTIDDPATPDTSVNGINDHNQLVGSTEFYGFLYDAGTGVFTEVKYPNSQYTQALAINDEGTIVGTFGLPGQLSQAYELIGSTFTTIMPRGSTFQTVATGIADSGEIVGTGYQSTTKFINFDFQNGMYHKLIPKVTNAHVLGINPAGTTMVGNIGGTVGFVYNGQRHLLLSFPGANETLGASGVNSAGMVAGSFMDSSFVVHGFLWTPPADAAKK